MTSVVRRMCLPLAAALLFAAGCRRSQNSAQTQMMGPQGPFECKPPATQEGYVPDEGTLPGDGTPSKGHIVVTLDPNAGAVVPMRDPVVVFGEPVGPCEPVMPTPVSTRPPTDPTPVGTPPQGQMGQGGQPGQGQGQGQPGQGQGQGQPGQPGQGQGQTGGGNTTIIPTPHIHQATQDVVGATGGGTMQAMQLAGSTSVTRVPFHNAAYSGSKFQRDKSLTVFNEGGIMRAYIAKSGTYEKVHYVGEVQACQGTTGKGKYRIIPKYACIVQYKDKTGGGGTPPPGQGQMTPSPGQGQMTPPPGQGQMTPPPGTVVVTPLPLGTEPPQQGQMTPPPGQGQMTPPPGQGQMTPPPDQGQMTPSQGGGTLISKGAGYVWYPEPPKTVPGQQPPGGKYPPNDPTPVKTPAKQPTPVKTPAKPPTPVKTPAKQPTPVKTPAKQPVVTPTPVKTPAKQPVVTPTPDAPIFTKPGSPGQQQPSQPIFTK